MIIPTSFAKQLHYLLSLIATQRINKGSQKGKTNANISRGVTGQISEHSHFSVSKPRGNPAASGALAKGSGQEPSIQLVQTGRSPNYSLHLLLVVKTGSSHHLSQIELHGASTKQFFRQLRSDYFKLRGCIRSFFSIWVYSHCDFYKVSISYFRQISLD
jgi:hypothetical protein